MLTLAQFIRARLDEAEAEARAAIQADAPHGTGRWIVEVDAGADRNSGCVVVSDGGMVIYDEGGHTPEHAAHIARHSPARVMAEVEAKRRIVDHVDYELADHGCDNPYWYDGKLIPLLRLLALPYAGHLDYRAEWKP